MGVKRKTGEADLTHDSHGGGCWCGNLPSQGRGVRSTSGTHLPARRLPRSKESQNKGGGGAAAREDLLKETVAN